MNKKNKSLKNTGLFLAFAGPAVFAFMAVVIIPFLYGFYLTFTSWDGLSKSKPFVGLANYAELFKDTGFWQLPNMRMHSLYLKKQLLEVRRKQKLIQGFQRFILPRMIWIRQKKFLQMRLQSSPEMQKFIVQR